jgi:hypothetical protein
MVPEPDSEPGKVMLRRHIRLAGPMKLLFWRVFDENGPADVWASARRELGQRHIL